MSEKYKYHYTPYKGWINDPNGLIYKDGVYHLYFQYNPLSPEWGNICWGHATSEDLMNWTTHGKVLEPDEHGMVFSGSAVAAGDDIYYFYTAAEEKHFTQRMAVSHDGGYTLIKDDDFEIPVICPENRDPKVIYHRESGAYVMILWLEDNDFAILRSESVNGRYVMSQRLTLPDGFECPNLFECDGMWFIWTADGFYYPGTFDGYEFKWNGIKHAAYDDRIPYAAQIFSGTDRLIMIPWLRTPPVDGIWTGMMGIPRILGTKRDGCADNDALLTQTAVFSDSDVITDAGVTEITSHERTVLSVAQKNLL